MQASEPAARKLLLAQLRPQLESAFESRGVAWGDAVRVLLGVGVDELRGAVEEPDSLLRHVLSAGGLTGRRLLLAQLQRLPARTRRGQHGAPAGAQKRMETHTRLVVPTA